MVTPAPPRAFAAAALALALSACMVGPDHVRPASPAPPAFLHAAAVGDAAQRADAPDLVQAGIDAGIAPSSEAGRDVGASREPAPLPGDTAAFWHRFGDAQLAALVEDALAHNYDLRGALARYDRANALLRAARFDRLPTLTADAQASEARASAGQAPGVPRAARDDTAYSAGIEAAWELDVFGRIRRGIEAGRADAGASSADLQALQVAIAGEVARTYLELRGLQARLQVARDNAGNQRETLRLVDALRAAGRGSDFDTARARAQLEGTLSRVPALEGEVAVAMHRLAVLTGQPPATLVATLSAPMPLPVAPMGIDAGTPGDLLRRRPDVAAAEQRLHAATARVGVATADLFPRFTLGGLIGSQALDAGDLFTRDSETRLVALGIDWSFLDAGRVRARMAAADADAEGALAQYRQAVLLALEDAENALVRYGRARREDAHLARAAADSAEAARLARVRFDAGASSLLEVLDAERSRLQAQDAFADARTRSATGAVAVYRALAGGWPDRMPVRERLARD